MSGMVLEAMQNGNRGPFVKAQDLFNEMGRHAPAHRPSCSDSGAALLRLLAVNALAMNLCAAPVEALVQVTLLGLGYVAAVLRHVVVQAVLFACELGIIAGSLSRVDLTIRHAAIDASLLVVDALLDLVDSHSEEQVDTIVAGVSVTEIIFRQRNLCPIRAAIGAPVPG